MLNEVKLALRLTETAYDAEVASVLMAGANDLKIAGVNLGGVISFSVANNQVVDNCTVTDELVKRALITYARLHFFMSPKEYSQLKESYDEQKIQLMHSTGYTDFGENGDDDNTSTGTGGEGA